MYANFLEPEHPWSTELLYVPRDRALFSGDITEETLNAGPTLINYEIQFFPENIRQILTNQSGFVDLYNVSGEGISLS